MDLIDIVSKFTDIKLEGRTFREMLDFESQPDYQLMCNQDLNKKIEYLTEKQIIQNALTNAELDKDFITTRMSIINIDLYPGIDKTKIKYWTDRMFYNSTDEKFYDSERKVVMAKDSLWDFISKDIIKHLDKHIVEDNEIAGDKYDHQAENRYLKKLRRIIESYIKNEKIYTRVSILQSPWITKQTAEIDSRNHSLVIAEPLTLRPYNGTESDKYKEHTEFWDKYANINEEIDWITATRFASDRRQCFLWQKFSSGWGKSFKGDIYKELGILRRMNTMELKKIIAGTPPGVTALDLYDKWVIMFDEFKFAGAELKEINNELTINQKNSYSAEVKVYAKIFASKEDVQSLTTDGLDDQFIERFLIQYGKHDKLKNHIPSVDFFEFKKDIELYTYRRLLNNIDMYIKLGEKKATAKADKAVAKMWKKYKHTGATIEKVFTEKIENLKQIIAEYFWMDGTMDQSHNDYQEYQMKHSIGRIMKCINIKDNIIYVHNLSKCEEEIKDWMSVGNTRKKIGFTSLHEVTDFPSSQDKTYKPTFNGGRLTSRRWFNIETVKETIKSVGEIPVHLDPLTSGDDWDPSADNGQTTTNVKNTTKTEKDIIADFKSTINKAMAKGNIGSMSIDNLIKK